MADSEKTIKRARAQGLALRAMIYSMAISRLSRAAVDAINLG